jgi:hypothetical protein
MRHRRLGVSGFAVLAMVLAGCASPAPASGVGVALGVLLATAAGAAPEPATAVIGAHAITVLDQDGDTFGEVVFTEPGSAAVELLTAVFDAPPVLSRQESDFNCVPAANVAVWDGYFTLAYDIEGAGGAGHSMLARATTRATPGGVLLLTASGFGVGDSVDALVASQPGVAVDSMDWEGKHYSSVHYDVGAGVFLTPDDENYDMAPYWGASAAAIDGTITTLQSPHAFVDMC